MNDKHDLTEKDFLVVLWNYFSLHSSQRTTLLNFYIVLESLFVTGLITLSELKGRYTEYQIVVCVAIIFFSFVFYRLDKRTKNLIKNSEIAIKSIETKYSVQFGQDIMIFTKESDTTASQRKKLNIAFSYTNLFNLIYIFFVAIGSVGIIYYGFIK